VSSFLSDNVSRWDDVRADWRFNAGLFFVIVLLETAAFGQLNAFTPLYLRRVIGMPEEEIPFWTGVLVATSLAVAVPLAPWWGVLADRYSRKLFIVRSMVVDGIGYAIAAIATDLWHVILLRMILGLSYGNIGIVFAAQSLVTPDRRVGSAIGIIQAAVLIGISVGPLLGGFIVERYGLRWLFMINSAVVGLAFLLTMVFLKEAPVRGAGSGIRQQLGTVGRFVINSPPIRWNFILWFLVACGVSSIDPYVPILIERHYDGPDLPSTIGQIMALYGIVTVIATPFVARLGERVGPDRWMAITTPWLAIAVLAMAFAPNPSLLVAAQLLRALFQSGTQTVLYAHMTAYVPRALRASIMGLSPLPRNVAMLLAPLGAAAISSLALSLVFVMGAAAYILAFLATFPLRRASQKQGREVSTYS
jgi:DHA1 family multidrug resistance protein-like MFS transporter